ncbi:MAG: hypothetical protein LUD46_00915 [Parabacteroides sp.]|nr:hypothetical protein [Parabacteroides sp.]
MVGSSLSEKEFVKEKSFPGDSRKGLTCEAFVERLSTKQIPVKQQHTKYFFEKSIICEAFKKL